MPLHGEPIPIVTTLLCVVVCCIYVFGTQARWQWKSLLSALVGASLLARGVLPSAFGSLVMWGQFLLGLVLLHLTIHEL